MIKTTTLAALAIVLSAPAYAATISAYDTVNGPSIAAGLTGAGVTAADLTRGAGLAQSGNNNHFRSNGWARNGTVNRAINRDDYIEWGFSSTSTYSLDTLSLRYGRNNNGPKAIAIFASYDGGAFAQIFTDTDVSQTAEVANINLAGLNVDGATFRLFGWDAATNGGQFYVRNNGVGEGNAYGISLTGDQIAVVPVPAGLPLLAGALAMFGLVRRKV